MANKRPPKLSDQIRQAVDAGERSRYRICKEIGIAQSTFSRFMSGGWLGKENMDALADLLGLNIASKPPALPKTDKTGKPRRKER